MIAAVDCCIHDGFVYFPGLQLGPRFLFFVFASRAPYSGLGKMGTQLNLNTETVGSISVGVPPLEEQQAIVAFLDDEWDRCHRASAAAQRQISLLEELRTRLISDVVTGKLDVREAAARLPDDPDAEVPELDEALGEAIEA